MRRSIRQSRKRKLKELYAVATILNGLPNFVPGHLDAPPANTDEAQFLEASDISK
jgi:chromatin modification-related protein VID21